MLICTYPCSSEARSMAAYRVCRGLRQSIRSRETPAADADSHLRRELNCDFVCEPAACRVPAAPTAASRVPGQLRIRAEQSAAPASMPFAEGAVRTCHNRVQIVQPALRQHDRRNGPIRSGPVASALAEYSSAPTWFSRDLTQSFSLAICSLARTQPASRVFSRSRSSRRLSSASLDGERISLEDMSLKRQDRDPRDRIVYPLHREIQQERGAPGSTSDWFAPRAAIRRRSITSSRERARFRSGSRRLTASSDALASSRSSHQERQDKRCKRAFPILRRGSSFSGSSLAPRRTCRLSIRIMASSERTNPPGFPAGAGCAIAARDWSCFGSALQLERRPA